MGCQAGDYYMLDVHYDRPREANFEETLFMQMMNPQAERLRLSQVGWLYICTPQKNV